jgi:hypothetical protein
MNQIPPHRPDLNAFVERFHKSLGQECLDKRKPKDLGETREAIDWYKQHYNNERPHQGLSCKNQPPRVANPNPEPLRSVPMWINPDAWLAKVDGWHCSRKVRKDGWVEVSKHGYYVGTAYAGRRVSFKVEAASRKFKVLLEQTQIKELDIKGLHGNREMSFEEYVKLMEQEAISEYKYAWSKGRQVLS